MLLQKRLQQKKLPNKERIDLLAKAVDKDGNSFRIDPTDDNKIWFQKLYSDDKLSLGKIMVGENNLLYYKFEDERNIFRKTDSWSINYEVFKQIDYIVYETLKNYYQISKERAEEFGEVLHFEGTEEKIYIPLKFWDQRKTLIDPKEERRRKLIGDSWYEKLGKVMQSPYMKDIANFIQERRKVAVVYPEQDEIFRAYRLCHFQQTKVIILGQDPYVDGSANGLAFGYKDNSKKQVAKSLDLIMREVERDVYDGMNLTVDFTLTSWAKQGVLLLNSSLTVEHGKSQSHSHIGWDRFIKITLYELVKDIRPKVFILWGSIAQSIYQAVIDKIREKDAFFMPNHLVLKAKHPAYDLRNNKDSFGEVKPDYPNTFSGCRHFSQTNKFLNDNKRKEIIW